MDGSENWFLPIFWAATSLETQVVLELLDTVDAWSLVWVHIFDFQTAQKPRGFAGDSGFAARFAHRVPILAVMTGPAMGFSLGRNFFVWSVSFCSNCHKMHVTQITQVHNIGRKFGFTEGDPFASPLFQNGITV